MILYHGGTDIIETPKIIIPTVGRDFGTGFYTTDIKDQACKWAKRTAKIRRAGFAGLNIYEYNETDARNNLRIKSFDDYSMEWLDLVLECRQDSEYFHGYDIVYGKIANDDVGETVQAVIDGLTPKDFALTKLSFMEVNFQICFCTLESLKYLKFISFERLEIK